MYKQVGRFLACTAVVIDDKRHSHNFFAALYRAGYLSDLKMIMEGSDRIAILYLANGVTQEMVYASLEAGEVLPLPVAPSSTE